MSRGEPMETDEELYERVRGGDMGAFDVLYERYAARLFRFLRVLLGNRHDAEDVFHEAFLRALKSPALGFEGGSFRAWLYRIARNAALNAQRKEARGARAKALLPDEPGPMRVDAAIEETELRRALDGAVARLPLPLSEVYHLRTSGLSYEEMASVLEIPLGTLKSRMNQLTVQLREELRPWTAG